MLLFFFFLSGPTPVSGKIVSLIRGVSERGSWHESRFRLAATRFPEKPRETLRMCVRMPFEQPRVTPETRQRPGDRVESFDQPRSGMVPGRNGSNRAPPPPSCRLTRRRRSADAAKWQGVSALIRPAYSAYAPLYGSTGGSPPPDVNPSSRASAPSGAEFGAVVPRPKAAP